MCSLLVFPRCKKAPGYLHALPCAMSLNGKPSVLAILKEEICHQSGNVAILKLWMAFTSRLSYAIHVRKEHVSLLM